MPCMCCAWVREEGGGGEVSETRARRGKEKTRTPRNMWGRKPESHQIHVIWGTTRTGCKAVSGSVSHMGAQYVVHTSWMYDAVHAPGVH
eukprot:8902566-Pyramimonas_sp.AAC.1